MDDINIKHLFLLLLLPSFFLSTRLYILSPINSKVPPNRKPIDIITGPFIFKLFVISKAGSIRLKKLAAIITPAEKPSIASITVLLTFLKKKTILAPNAVTPQVNKVAINVCQTGDKFLNASNNFFTSISMLCNKWYLEWAYI